MDRGGQVSGGPRPVMDITPPGASPAPSSSKPVITNNQPVRADPMMAPTQAAPVQPKPVSSQAPTMSSSPQEQVVSTPQTPAETMPILKPAGHTLVTDTQLHKLTHEEPFFGHIKPKKGKLAIFFVLLLLAGIAAAAYFFLVMNK